MATSDSQKQLFTLIRDFASEKSQGEKRVITLKKRIEELDVAVEEGINQLEDVKRRKETAEQEVKGYEVELTRSETSIVTLEARIASIQDEISKIGSDVDAIKYKEAALRDEFINQMLQLKFEIREFQGFYDLQKRSGPKESSDIDIIFLAERNHVSSLDADMIDLQKKISSVIAETAAEEEACEREQQFYNQFHQELTDARRKLDLINLVMKQIKELQDLTRLTSEMEEKCSTFSEELQRSCLCPKCHRDNSEALAELLQAMDHN